MNQNSSRNIASDVVCIYERDKGYEDFKMPPWTSAHSSDHFSLILYQIAEAKQMSTIVKSALKAKFGYIFVTDAKGENPYDRLPTYWDVLVVEVEAANRQQPNRQSIRQPTLHEVK
ncbi:MAG: spherulation-specific family 4 protein [Chthonomonadales bacterium]